MPSSARRQPEIHPTNHRGVHAAGSLPAFRSTGLGTFTDPGYSQDVMARLPERLTKEVTETLSASTTLQDDNELLFPLMPQTRYRFSMPVKVTADGDADFKFDFAVPTGSTGELTWNYARAGGTVSGGNNDLTTDETVLVPGTSSLTFTLNISGEIFVPDVPGVFQFRWAQATSDSSNTSVLKGSTFELVAIE